MSKQDILCEPVKMSELKQLYIAATGMMTPIGIDSQMTADAVQAGINVYQDSSFFNRKYAYMRISAVPDDAFEMPTIDSQDILVKQTRYRRMLGLATVALNELYATIPVEQSIPLFLGGPETSLNQKVVIDSAFIRHLAECSGHNIDVANSRLFATGRTAGLEAIELAFEYMQQMKADYILVGAVDSYIDLDVLGHLEREQRILASGIADGFVPGEAAGFILLASQQGIEKLNKKYSPSIQRPGIAQETGHRYSQEPYQGNGLAEATRLSLQSLGEQKVGSLYSSMNGESFFAKEHGVALMRNNEQLNEVVNVQHPADCFGDLGAATGIVLTALASIDLSRKTKPSSSLICCSADQSTRAACVLQLVQ